MSAPRRRWDSARRISSGVFTRARSIPIGFASCCATGPGVTELMVHPGYLDEALKRTGTRLLESRAQELELLCSMKTRAIVAGERIELVRHDLTHPARRSFRHVS